MAGSLKERALPLSENQRVILMKLILGHEKVLMNKYSGPGVLERKKAAWQNITARFNATCPDQHPRSDQQLRRAHEHIKRKVKKEDQDYRKKVLTAGGGPPPQPPSYTEDMTLAASMMKADLEMAGQSMEIGVPSVSAAGSISLPDVDNHHNHQSSLRTSPSDTLSTENPLPMHTTLCASLQPTVLPPIYTATPPFPLQPIPTFSSATHMYPPSFQCSQQTSSSLTITSQPVHPICIASGASTHSPSLPVTSSSVPQTSVPHPSPNPPFTSPSTISSPPITFSASERAVPRPLKRRLADECDALWERQLDEHNYKQKYWRMQLQMQEEELVFQTKARELQLKEAEACTKFLEVLHQRMEQSFDKLGQFLDSGTTAYEAVANTYQ